MAPRETVDNHLCAGASEIAGDGRSQVSALGTHAGLALAGVVAGLPVAAVVQVRREPPPELWCPDRRPDPHALWKTVPFYTSPGGCRVTSVRDSGASDSQGGEWRSAFTFEPQGLERLVVELVPSHRGCPYLGVVRAADARVEHGGAAWTRFEVWEWTPR